MKQQIFYIHGGCAFSSEAAYEEYLRTSKLPDVTVASAPRDRWADKLRPKLGEEYEVFTPEMPNKLKSKYEEWKIWFERYVDLLRDDVILIGYSQGGMFFTKYLIENKPAVKVKALILVAAPFKAELFEGHDYYGEDGGDFIFDTTRLAEVALKVGEIHILHSEDDFVAPYAHAEKFKAALPTATLHTLNDRGHFLVPEFPELIDLIKKVS